MREKTLRVSNEEYELLQEAKSSLMESGIGELKDHKNCPNCGNELHGFDIKSYNSKCPQCGTELEGIWISTTEAPVMGSIVGLGMGALLTYISKKKRRRWI